MTTVEWRTAEALVTSTTTAGARKLTYRDFVRFPDDGQRHELVDGVHYVTPSPVSPHQRVVGNLHFLLRLHLEQQAGGMVFLSPLDVVFTMFDIVEPDLLFISDARRHILTRRNVRGAPDLVIEVLSPSTRRRDEGVKLKLYDRSDVIEYWVVDPDAETIRIYRRVEGQLSVVANPAGPLACLTSLLFPGLSLSLARVFAQ
jgi:Uma2 family endonuclease